MIVVTRPRVLLGCGLLAYGAGLTILVCAAASGHGTAAAQALTALLPALLLGVLVAWRRPDSPVGPALVALAAAPCLTWGLEEWGATYATADPWPAAGAMAFVAGGVWVFNLAGFVLLCLVFPDGRLPGRVWTLLPWAYLAAAGLVIAVIGPDPQRYGARGGPLPGRSPLPLHDAVYRVLDVVAGLGLLAVLGGAVASLVVHYRRGDHLTRVRVRWLMLGAGSVPVLLAAGWLAELTGAPVDVAYSGFLLAMLLVMPATVAIAILRHDLLDVDRLLSGTVAWVVTSIVSAGVFAAVVLAVAQAGAGAAGGRIGVTAAAFLTALVLLPVHRRVHDLVGRVLDRERTVMISTIRQFVRDVRDGRAQPEEVQSALRTSLNDPSLRVLLRLPASPGYVDLAGEPADDPGGQAAGLIPLTARDSEVGALLLGRSTARRRRRAREVAVEARLPIEVSRLRVELRRALDDARASRARLVHAVADERQRLERDLHDGAQQRILAVGMRLRSVQRRLRTAGGSPPDGGAGTQADLDAAVAALEATVAELRRLAQGIRPSRLDDGLDAAIRDLVRDSPIPVDLHLAVAPPAAAGEAVATTAYYVVAECLANAFKHAAASRVAVSASEAAGRLVVEVRDDGRGGVDAASGLTALRDRVAALGGRIDVVSPAGAGTTVRAEL